MADAIVSAVAEQIVGLIAEQARFHINLVRGAEKEVLQLSDELKMITYVLDDAENRRFKDKTVNYWLSKLEHTSREMEDVLDEWNYKILKLEMEQHQSDDAVVVADPPPSKQKPVCSFIPSSSCFSFKKVVVRHDIANKILNVKAKLDQVLKEKDKYNFVSSQPSAETSHKSWRDSTSFTTLVEVEGQDSDRDILVTKLLGKQEELGSIQVVSIVGVGGLGKTTLAQLVYGDSRVDKFFDLRIWVCVSDPFDLAAIAKGIIESVSKGDSPHTKKLETLLQSVSDSIAGKTFFLVLDDVWTEDYKKWDALKSSLKCGGMGSKILVTTRNEKVAKITGTVDNDIHRPGKLSHEDSWLLLRHIADQPGMEFEEIGKKIARKCDGMPLAVKTLGSVLRFKNTLEKWENVLESEVWQLEEAKTDLFPHLLLSYNELSPTLKRCFSYCAVFPKDFEINVESLIGYWMALGYLGSDIGKMELKGQECFDILAMSSLFQDFEKNDLDEKIKSCKMHDIVHDFAQFLRKSGKVEATGMNKTSCQACDPLLVSTVNEFCTLFVSGEEFPQNFCGCLKRLRVLRMSYCESIPRGIENMIHLRHLDLSENSSLKELPREIGNLIQLRHLDLSMNSSLKELPREIGNLIQLRHLDLSWNSYLKELPREIGILIQLRHLDLRRNSSLKELPREIGNLIELRHLFLSKNSSLKELPREIGNLIQLRHLDLSRNSSLKELPREIGNLIQLRHLDLSENESLEELPESICSLHELETLDVLRCSSLRKIPEGVGQLTGLHRLGQFYGGNGWNKLGLLNKLNHLRDSLVLTIGLANYNLEQVVEDAREAELRNKTDINKLAINFEDEMDESDESALVRMNVMDALEPHPNLISLDICNYKGPKLPLTWIVSPLNQLREIYLYECNHLSSLPPLGKLPCLEEIYIYDMDGLEIVGREFLGEMELDFIAFPKLKRLAFNSCRNWKEWEDVTSEEEESADVTLMPCLLYLDILDCRSLTMLPHGLLHKVASSLESLDISNSTLLVQHYRNEDGSDWKSISQYNPPLQLKR